MSSLIWLMPGKFCRESSTYVIGSASRGEQAPANRLDYFDSDTIKNYKSATTVCHHQSEDTLQRLWYLEGLWQAELVFAQEYLSTVMESKFRSETIQDVLNCLHTTLERCGSDALVLLSADDRTVPEILELANKMHPLILRNFQAALNPAMEFCLQHRLRESVEILLELSYVAQKRPDKLEGTRFFKWVCDFPQLVRETRKELGNLSVPDLDEFRKAQSLLSRSMTKSLIQRNVARDERSQQFLQTSHWALWIHHLCPKLNELRNAIAGIQQHPQLFARYTVAMRDKPSPNSLINNFTFPPDLPDTDKCYTESWLNEHSTVLSDKSINALKSLESELMREDFGRQLDWNSELHKMLLDFNKVVHQTDLAKSKSSKSKGKNHQRSNDAGPGAPAPEVHAERAQPDLARAPKPQPSCAPVPDVAYSVDLRFLSQGNLAQQQISKIYPKSTLGIKSMVFEGLLFQTRLSHKGLAALISLCFHPATFLTKDTSTSFATARSAYYHLNKHARGTCIEDYVLSALSAHWQKRDKLRETGDRKKVYIALGTAVEEIYGDSEHFGRYVATDGRIITYCHRTKCKCVIWEKKIQSLRQQLEIDHAEGWHTAVSKRNLSSFLSRAPT